jgi:hypothetical protein
MVIGMPSANSLPTRTCQLRQSRKALTGRTTKRSDYVYAIWLFATSK